MEAYYEVLDSKGNCLVDGESLTEMHNKLVASGEATLQPEPDVAKILITVAELDKHPLGSVVVKNFCDELRDACEWQQDDGQDAKGKAQHYERKYGDV